MRHQAIQSAHFLRHEHRSEGMPWPTVTLTKRFRREKGIPLLHGTKTLSPADKPVPGASWSQVGMLTASLLHPERAGPCGEVAHEG